MGRLTTHVLDTVAGRPATGLQIDLHRIGSSGLRDSQSLLASAISNRDGRCDAPLLEGRRLLVGVYELVFHAGRYYEEQGTSLPAPPFLGEVVIRFGVADPTAHYHVPLLLSPYGYSTYRGS